MTDKRPTRLFFDLEFTGLHQRTTLISIGIVAESGEKFYAELDDFDLDQVNNWLEDHILRHLWIRDPGKMPPRGVTYFIGNAREVRSDLAAWLAQFGPVEVWGDCLAYDWVLFCELFGGARNLPANVFYIPFDLATKFKEYGIDPDVDRTLFAGMQAKGPKHNALFDACVIQACHDRLSLFAPEVSYSRSSNIVIGRPT